MQRKTIVRFLLIAFAIYAVLTLGLPIFGQLYAQGFRAALLATIVSDSGARQIEVPAEQPSARVTHIVIVNRQLLAADGSGPIRNVNLPTSAFWHASALLLSLALASPCTWLLRLRAALVGFLCVQAFIACALSFVLWNEGRHVGLSAISPAWSATTDQMGYILMEQAILFVPILAWLVGLWQVSKRQ